eukprot:scaffold3795_cov126-Isochrysis_galbana.AAC.18
MALGGARGGVEELGALPFDITVRRVKRISRQIAKELNISGPFNLQLLAKDNDVKVIEANVRASRTFPFSSKTLKVNFIELATRVMVGAPAQPFQISLLDLDYVAIKAPMFSFTRLVGADPVLGVEMASTGEVATFGEDRFDAILTSMMSTGFRVPKRSVFLCIGPVKAKMEFLPQVRLLLEMGLALSCSQGTYDFYKSHGLDVSVLHKPLSEKRPNVTDAIKNSEIDLVINVRDSKADEASKTDGFLIRRAAVDCSVCLLTDIKLATLILGTSSEAERQQASVRARHHIESELTSPVPPRAFACVHASYDTADLWPCCAAGGRHGRLYERDRDPLPARLAGQFHTLALQRYSGRRQGVGRTETEQPHLRPEVELYDRGAVNVCDSPCPCPAPAGTRQSSSPT